MATSFLSVFWVWFFTRERWGVLCRFFDLVWVSLRAYFDGFVGFRCAGLVALADKHSLL